MIHLQFPRPHAAQSRVIKESRRFNVLCCGRRWGKTELGMDRLCQTALAGKPAAWFAPTYKQASPVFRELQIRLAPVIKSSDKQERHISLLTGGLIDVWSLDGPDAGRGRAYKRIIVDEAAIIPNLRDAWQQSLRAQLTDYQGDAWFLSTPKGIASPFHELFQRGRDALQPEWAAWHMPTGSNPYIVPSEIESARGDMTELAFAQEYLAEFVSWEGAVFRRIRDAVGPEPDNLMAAVIGVDWGRTSDYTVFIALSARGEMVAIDRFRGIEYGLQRARLEQFWTRLGRRSVIIAEVNSMGGPVVEQLQSDGLPVRAFTTTAATKAAIVDALALAFERGVIKILDDVVMIGELQAFESSKTPSGMTRYAAPEGMHDDTVMALAIAWSGLYIANQFQTERNALANAERNINVWQQISSV